jgi:hypothetical protein
MDSGKFGAAERPLDADEARARLEAYLQTLRAAAGQRLAPAAYLSAAGLEMLYGSPLAVRALFGAPEPATPCGAGHPAGGVSPGPAQSAPLAGADGASAG